MNSTYYSFLESSFFSIFKYRSTVARGIFVLLGLAAMLGTMIPAFAQGAPAAGMAPITLAQAVTAPPQFVPTDTTPFTLYNERSFNPGFRFRLFQVLPERLWFNITTEASQRLDTNVFFTNQNNHPDYVFRILPNITLGYNLTRNTSIYANYFVIKDTFFNHTSLNFPTTQSLSWGVRHINQIGKKNSLQLDFQARELWETAHLNYFDFIPSATFTRAQTPKDIFFFSTLLQLRGVSYFVAPTREIDPFFTLGYIKRFGHNWTFIADDTYIMNWRQPPFHYTIPTNSNMAMIADFEINHPISKKLPGALWFVRAEPIWNWMSGKEPGISGFDFRLYSGIRLVLNKPSYYASAEDMRRKLLEAENLPRNYKGMSPSLAAANTTNKSLFNSDDTNGSSVVAPSEMTAPADSQSGGTNGNDLDATAPTAPTPVAGNQSAPSGGDTGNTPSSDAGTNNSGTGNGSSGTGTVSPAPEPQHHSQF